MKYTNKLIKLAEAFSSCVKLSFDYSGNYLVSINKVSYKNNKHDIMARSIFGVGSSIESATEDFLNKASGKILFGDDKVVYGDNPPEYICL